jgi:hypothetical protein
MKSLLKPLQNERGILTTDYLFALVLVMGFGGILFSLSLTLTVVEITQYITFAAARSYSVGHINVGEQTRMGQSKYQELITNPTFAPLYENGWFETAAPVIGDLGRGQISGYEADSLTGTNLFQGAGVRFTARMLDFRIPFYGSTVNDDTEEGFNTFVTSFLSREPNSGECIIFQNERYEQILNLDVPVGSLLIRRRLDHEISLRQFTITDVDKMKTLKRVSHSNIESGMATIETIPILVIFLVLISYGLGLWGSVHTAVCTPLQPEPTPLKPCATGPMSSILGIMARARLVRSTSIILDFAGMALFPIQI